MTPHRWNTDCAALVGLLFSTVAFAADAATGAIQGRVFNPATQEYVRNAEFAVTGTSLVAYSADDGSFTLTNVPAGEVTLTGRIAPPPARLYEFDGAGTGPIRQNLALEAFRRETGLPLVDGSVQQAGNPSEGLLRDWPAPASGAEKNYGYAFQWWALSGLILILYVWFQFIAPRRRRARPA